MKNKIKTGIILTTVAVGVLHVMNCCINKAATIKNLLSRDEGHYFDWRFGKIFYTKSGSGSPLLFIHDLNPSSSSYEWKEMVQKFSKDHTVYCIDLLGCGRSEKPNLTYTNYFYVQLVSDFIEQVIGDKTDVAATGLSSSFVIMSCHMNPDLFNRIIMVNPESINNLCRCPGKRSKITKLIMDCPIIGSAVYNMIVSTNNIEYQLTEKYYYNPFLVNRKTLHVFYESSHLGESGGKYLLSSINGFYLNANISTALQEINNSIFIIEGKYTPNAKAVVDAYFTLNPAIESTYIDNVKLYPQLENPEAFYENMNLFLQ